MDEFALARLRRACRQLAATPALEWHLEIVSPAAASYATAIAPSWDPAQPDALFGVARHYVRTRPDADHVLPDVEGWLAAGRPSDAEAARRFDLLLTARYPAGEPAAPNTGSVPDATDATDAIVRAWPAEHFERFVHAYARVEAAMADQPSMPDVAT